VAVGNDKVSVGVGGKGVSVAVGGGKVSVTGVGIVIGRASAVAVS